METLEVAKRPNLDYSAVAGNTTVKITEHHARPGMATARRVGTTYGAALSNYALQEA